ncbi:MAG TPA: uroporphyrinogen-III synthase [Gemmatimonadaceae bacterium]|nr:uroporphyrinogen-III synthase [Gemmatimonadaceae bacterium]
MSLLGGARIGLLEARLSSELAELVRREGGEPVCAPAVSEAPVDVTPLLPRLCDDLGPQRLSIFVFLTGAGATSLLDQARGIGVYDTLVDALRSVTTVCRGPKPGAVLRKHGIPVHVNARSPYTTAELLEVLPDTLVAGQEVALLHDGGGNPPLVQTLRARGAWVRELHSYEWRLPDHVEPIEVLIDELIDGRLDAVAFTNQVQVRHVFQVAARIGRTAALRYALRHRTIVASIGPTCSLALEEHGVPPHTVASPPKMRPLVAAVGDQLAARRGHPTADSTS